jgi:glycosyltransferase involved in cell wall biosynthesis
MAHHQRRISLAVIHDMPEEGWSSMDQMGELISTRVPMHSSQIRTTAIRHHLVRLASRMPLGNRRQQAWFADRVLNRMVLYPRRIRREVSGRYNLYHVVDHSYAQLVHELPAESTVVTCHDVDTFRCLASPGEEIRSRPFRVMTHRILSGLRRAACVICGSQATRDDLVRFRLVPEERLRVVPNGIDPDFLPDPSALACEWAARHLTQGADPALDLLHVGNDVPRKRLDRLLRIVDAVRASGMNVRLVRVGSPLARTHKRLAAHLNVPVVELPYLDRDVLRAVYARCAVVLMPSDREGFGLPVIEAFAAGRPAVISDIPSLREVSGGLARWVAPDDIRGWVDAITNALKPQDVAVGEYARRAHAATLTWDTHAQGLLPIYDELVDRIRGVTQCA